MNDHLPPDEVSNDVSWARQHLGVANPVPSPGDVTPPRPGLIAALVTTEANQDVSRLEVPQVTTHRRARVTAALVGAAVVVGGVVAAGAISSGGSGHGVTGLPGTQSLFAAASTTEAARTAQVSLSVTVATTVTNVQGVADLSTGNADFTADLPAGIGAVEVRRIGSVAYVQLPSSLRPLLGGKPWVKADVPTVEGLAGQQFGLPGLSGGLDFTGVLDWLRGVSGQVTTVGTDTIHGDETTHYHADVDLAKAAANAPSASRAKLEQAAQAAGQTVPLDVWIDNQGRLRQLRASFDPSKVQAPTGVTIKRPGSIVATFELWNFGAPVDVTPPPADQVSPLTGVAGALKGLLGGAGIPGSKRGDITSATLAS